MNKPWFIHPGLTLFHSYVNLPPGPWAYPMQATKKRADDRPKMAMGAFGKSVRAVLNVAGFFHGQTTW